MAAVRVCPSVPSWPTCGRDVLAAGVVQAAAMKKAYFGLGFVFPRQKVFLKPVPTIHSSSDFAQSGSEGGCPEMEKLLPLEMGYPIQRSGVGRSNGESTVR